MTLGLITWAGLAAGLIAEDGSVRDALTRWIQDCGHEAVYFETSPVCAATTSQPFSAVLLPAPALERAVADVGPFAAKLEGTTWVKRFANLGGDAELIVPTATGDYPHLCAFVRRAPAAQIDALWRELGVAVAHWWATHASPLWLSTAGLGVPWLHLRLDRRPKYYRHHPFRAWPPASAS